MVDFINQHNNTMDHEKIEQREMLRKLYPNLTESEIKEAEDTIDGYLTVILRIFEQVTLESYPSLVGAI